MGDPVIRASKFLSLLLRHAPDTIGLELDERGWASIDDIVRQSAGGPTPLTKEIIELVVRTSDKQRFRISDDGLRVRASQGHSLDVDLDLRECIPPEVLYHGTTIAFLPSIRADGLVRGGRQYVHLSADAITARRVGARHGAPVVLEIRAKQMASAGSAFYLSDNGVWLTLSVPSEWIRFPPAMTRGSSLSPPGWHTVTPRIVARGAQQLVEFVNAVFETDGEYRSDRPAVVTIGDSMVMISDAGARDPVPAFLYVYVHDADATYRRAIDAGATSVEEPIDTPYGDRRAMVVDRWGNTWQVATYKGST